MLVHHFRFPVTSNVSPTTRAEKKNTESCCATSSKWSHADHVTYSLVSFTEWRVCHHQQASVHFLRAIRVDHHQCEQPLLVMLHSPPFSPPTQSCSSSRPQSLPPLLPPSYCLQLCPCFPPHRHLLLFFFIRRLVIWSHTTPSLQASQTTIYLVIAVVLVPTVTVPWFSMSVSVLLL